MKQPIKGLKLSAEMSLYVFVWPSWCIHVCGMLAKWIGSMSADIALLEVITVSGMKLNNPKAFTLISHRINFNCMHFIPITPPINTATNSTTNSCSLCGSIVYTEYCEVHLMFQKKKNISVNQWQPHGWICGFLWICVQNRTRILPKIVATDLTRIKNAVQAYLKYPRKMCRLTFQK